MKQVKKITDKEILAIVIDTLSKYISIDTISRHINNTSFLQTIVGIAAKKSSIEAFPKKFELSLTSKQLRYHLQSFDTEKVENAINKALKHHVSHSISHRNRSYKFAIDLHYKPYHGEPYKDENEVCRSKAKSGTTHFHVYATIYLIKNKKRYTLAMKYVRNGDDLLDIITFLIEQIHSIGLKIKRLYLDKGFYSTEIIDYLQKEGLPFIIPVAFKGRKGKDGKSGIERLLKGNKSYITDYPLKSVKNGKKTNISFKLYIVVRIIKKKNKHKIREYYAYALSEITFPIKRLYNEYRLRFGIETSYKKKNESLCRTSSRRPEIRLLYTGLSFFLVNTWIFMKWNFLGEKEREKYKHLISEFIYERFCELIFEALKPIFKYRSNIEYIEQNSALYTT